MDYNEAEDDHKGLDLIQQAMDCWDSRANFRLKRKRNRTYLLDDQWSDQMRDPTSTTDEYISEREFIERSGRLAIQNNLLRPIVFNLVGQYRQVQPAPVAIARNATNAQIGDMITGGLRYALDINEYREIDAGEMMECVLSGSFGWKSRYSWIPELDRTDVVLDGIDQTRLFFNNDLKDRRAKGLNFIGEIHDYSIDEIISDFATDPEDAERIKGYYKYDRFNERFYQESEASNYFDNRDFLIADQPNKYRVVEVWVLEYRWQQFVHDPIDGSVRPSEESEEEIAQRNQARLEEAAMLGIPDQDVPLLDVSSNYEPMWNVYYLTPYGNILFKAESPYTHQMCPYDIGLYPYLDGETVGVVEMVLDQQRQFNRLLSQLDQSISMANKGWWMIPKEAIGKLTEQEFVDKTMTYGNYVFYEAEALRTLNARPEFHQGQSIPVGASELANLQKSLMQEISGVLGSAQGQAPPAGTPASLYAQQNANASTTQRDIFDYFNSVVKRRNRKVCMIQRQFYTEDRNVRTSSFTKTGFDGMYRSFDVQDIDFDISLGESSNNVVYRQMIDSYLIDFVSQGLIPFEDFLETTSLPFAQTLLQRLKQRQETEQNMPPPDPSTLPPTAQQKLAA